VELRSEVRGKRDIATTRYDYGNEERGREERAGQE
jgi:hypothetical protein